MVDWGQLYGELNDEAERFQNSRRGARGGPTPPELHRNFAAGSHAQELAPQPAPPAPPGGGSTPRLESLPPVGGAARTPRPYLLQRRRTTSSQLMGSVGGALGAGK